MEEQQKALTTKEKILDAAYLVFMQNGVNGTGIKEIADKADVNKAMLYYYFDSKEHLFTQVFQKAVEESGLKALEVMENLETTLFEKIKLFIDQFSVYLLDNPLIVSFVMNELNRHPETLSQILVEAVDFNTTVLEGQIEEAADNYEIARVKPEQLLANIISLCLGPVINKQYYSVLLDIETEAEYREFLRERNGIIYDMTISWLTS